MARGDRETGAPAPRRWRPIVNVLLSGAAYLLAGLLWLLVAALLLEG